MALAEEKPVESTARSQAPRDRGRGQALTPQKLQQSWDIRAGQRYGGFAPLRLEEGLQLAKVTPIPRHRVRGESPLREQPGQVVIDPLRLAHACLRSTAQTQRPPQSPKGTEST